MTVNRRTLAELLAQQKALDAIQDDQQRALAARWAKTWDRLESELRTRTLEIAQLGDDVGVDAIVRHIKASRALSDVTGQLTSLLATSQAMSRSNAQAMIARAAADQQALIATQLPPGWTLNLLRHDPGQLDAIVKRTLDQITVRHYYLNARATESMKQALVNAVAIGDNPRVAADRMVKAVRGQFEGGLARATVIARTEQIDAYRSAAMLEQNRHPDVMAGWRWAATMSARTCPSCLSMHGTIHDIDEPGPLGHQQCLLPGAIIAGPPPSAATARWYEGEVCDIKTAAGRDLSVTPNHPILTARGWIPAGLLREGDHLVSSSGAELVAIGAGPDDEQIPPLIENVVEALLGSPSVLAVGMPTAAEDFHGDGAGSQVHVVATNGLLGYALDPTFGDPSSELQLFSGRMSEELLAGAGDVRDVLVGVGAALDGSVSRCNQCGVLFSTATGGHLPVGRGVVSKGHASHRESLADEGPGDSEALGDFIQRLSADVPGDDVLAVDALKERLADVLRLEGASLLGGSPETLRLEDGSEASLAYPIPSAADLAAHAGQVVTDRVVDIGRRSWQGHVYNLQTETGWYLANSIVVHNCRCARVPVTKTWEQLGFHDIPEPPGALKPGDGIRWLERQSDDVQSKIMGPKRYDAWKSGDYPPEDWSVRIKHWSTDEHGRMRQDWRDSIHVGPVRKPGEKGLPPVEPHKV